MNLIRTALLTAAVAATCFPLIDTLAAEAPGVHVSYTDLDLSTTKGVNSLYRRIQRAAAQYCDDLQWHTGSRIASGHEACVADAVGNTVRKLNVPALTAYHAEHATTAGRS